MEAAYAPPAYKNRKTGLVVFGIALIALGGLYLLLMLLAALGQLMAAKTTGDTNLRIVLPSVLMYGALGVLLVTLGIGSIKCRRWARALTLVLSWACLVVGVVSIFMFILLGPAFFDRIAEMEGEPLPPAARTIIMVVAVGVIGVFFVLIPGLLALFYGSSNVKATVEGMDPQPRWTDACPLPALAVSLLAAFGAITLLTMPFAYNGAIPLFGTILSGFAGSLLWLVLAALMGYAAWSIYHLRVAGWWILLGMWGVLTISNVTTFSRVDLMTLYRHMGYPEKQLELMEKLNIFTPAQVVMWNVLFMVPVIGYLIFIKKYFRPTTPI